MLLNSTQISEFISESEFSKRAQIGIDLSVKMIEKVEAASIVYKDKTEISKNGFKTEYPIEKDGREFWILGPGVYSITFNEGIKVPKDCAAKITHRSSLYRTGNIIESPWWDPGFYCDNMNTIMIINNPITIEVNARLAQIAFWRIEEIGELYDGQFQGLSTSYKS
jgi:dUTP pyrophosphatase